MFFFVSWMKQFIFKMLVMMIMKGAGGVNYRYNKESIWWKYGGGRSGRCVMMGHFF